MGVLVPQAKRQIGDKSQESRVMVVVWFRGGQRTKSKKRGGLWLSIRGFGVSIVEVVCLVSRWESPSTAFVLNHAIFTG